jgi:hypothetical protein
MIINQNELKYLKNIDEISSIKNLELYIYNKRLKKSLSNKLLKRNDEDSQLLKELIDDYDDYDFSMSIEKVKAEYNILIKYEIYETLIFDISKNDFHDILKKL